MELIQMRVSFFRWYTFGGEFLIVWQINERGGNVYINKEQLTDGT